MTLDDARDLIATVAAENGLVAPSGWQATELDGLGWVFGPRDVFSNLAIAVTSDGRVGTYAPSSMNSEEALDFLVALPANVMRPHPLAPRSDPPAQVSADEALAIARLASPAGSREAPQRVERLLDRGWVVSSGSEVAVVSADGRVAVAAPHETAEHVLRCLEVPFLPALAAGRGHG